MVFITIDNSVDNYRSTSLLKPLQRRDSV